MSSTLAFGLLLQAIALAVVAGRVGARWLANSGSLLLVVLVIYHGLTEPVQLMFPNRNAYRLMTYQRSLDATVLMAGVAILVFAVSYVLARGRDVDPPADHEPLRVLWESRVPIFLAAGLTTSLRLSGQITDLAGLGTESGYWRTGLVVEFGDFTLVLAGLALLYRFRSERALASILGGVAMVAILAGGSRLLMLIVVLSVLVTALRYGYVMRFSRLVVLGGLGLMLMIALSAARQAVGREELRTGGTTDRIEGIVGGIRDLGSSNRTQEGVLDDFVYRFDGNAFSAMVRDQYESGMRPMGLIPLGATVVLMVPSFAFPAKLDVDPLLLNEKYLSVLYFGFPLGDYNVMGLGQFYAMFDTLGLMVVAMLGGMFFGRIDHWLPRRTSLFAVIVGIGLLRCVTYYEWGPSIYLATIRTCLGLYAALAVWMWVQNAFTGRDAPASLEEPAPAPEGT